MGEALHSGSTNRVFPLADVCLTVGTSAFGETLLRAVNTVAAVDHCTILSFYRQVPSGDLLCVGKGAGEVGGWRR